MGAASQHRNSLRSLARARTPLLTRELAPSPSLSFGRAVAHLHLSRGSWKGRPPAARGADSVSPPSWAGLRAAGGRGVAGSQRPAVGPVGTLRTRGPLRRPVSLERAIAASPGSRVQIGVAGPSPDAQLPNAKTETGRRALSPCGCLGEGVAGTTHGHWR